MELDEIIEIARKNVKVCLDEVICSKQLHFTKMLWRHKQQFVVLAICREQQIFKFYWYVYANRFAASSKNIFVLLS